MKEDEKICKVCKKVKHLLEFWVKNRRFLDTCKECYAKRDFSKERMRPIRGERIIDYKAEQEQKVKIQSNASNYMSNYGITVEKYLEMLEKQNWCCFICGRHQTLLKKSLAVDHNHKTGKVRGLLCGSCNMVLGILKEDKETVKYMLKYLEIHDEENLQVEEFKQFKKLKHV